MGDLALITALNHSGFFGKNFVKFKGKKLKTALDGTQDLGHSFSQYGPPGWWITYIYHRKVSWYLAYQETYFFLMFLHSLPLSSILPVRLRVYNSRLPFRWLCCCRPSISKCRKGIQKFVIEEGECQKLLSIFPLTCPPCYPIGLTWGIRMRDCFFSSTFAPNYIRLETIVTTIVVFRHMIQ